MILFPKRGGVVVVAFVAILIISMTVGPVLLSWTKYQLVYPSIMSSFHVEHTGYLHLNATHRQQEIIASKRNVIGSQADFNGVPNSEIKGVPNSEFQGVPNAETKLVTFDPFKKYVTILAKRYRDTEDPSLAEKGRHLKQKDMKYHFQNWTSDNFLYVRVTERYKGILSEGGSNIYGTSISHLDRVANDDGGDDADGDDGDGDDDGGDDDGGGGGNNGDDSPMKTPEDEGSSLLSLCAYEDYFNGTYLVQCPLYSSNVDVEFDLSIITVDVPHGQIIANKPIKVPLYRDNIRGIRSRDIGLVQQPVNCWLRTHSNNWHWYDETSSLMDLSLDKYCKVAASFDRLYFIGSSNIRNQFSYLLKVCSDKVPDLRLRAVSVFAVYGQDLNGQIHDMVESYRRKNCEDDGLPPIRSYKGKCLPDQMKPADGKPLQVYTYTDEHRDYTHSYLNLMKDNGKCWSTTAKNELKLDFCRPSNHTKIGIMVQTGAWDLSGRKSNKEFIEKFQQRFDQVILNVSQTFGASHNVRFLVMGPPTTAFSPQKILFDEVLRKVCHAHGVYYFPYTAMLLPRHDEHVDRKHYVVCRWKEGMRVTCNGNVGKDVARAAIFALDQGD